MFILAIFGIIFIGLIISFWTTNEGSTWEEKMESLDKKLENQKLAQRTLDNIPNMCQKVMAELDGYYKWAFEISSTYQTLSPSIIEENEHKQVEILAPLFTYKMNFLEDLKQAFYSHALSANGITDSAGYWNHMWIKSYDENVLLKNENLKILHQEHKEEFLSLVTIKTLEIQMILEHKCYTPDNYVTTEQIEKMMNLINTVNKSK